MAIAEVEPRRSGIGQPMPVKTVDIKLDEIGYPGWTVTMRTDPRASVYDELVSGDETKWWAAFGKVVIDWNLTDEDGEPVPQPKTTESERELDLRVGVLTFILNRYFEAVRASAAVPKASSDNSDRSSSTSDGDQRSG